MNDSSPSSDATLERTAIHADGLRGRSVRGAAYMAGAGAVESVVRLAATVMLARILSPQELGLVTMVIVLLGFLEFIKDLGLGIVTQQCQEITNQEVSALFWINVFLGTFFTVLLAASAPLIASFYADERLVMVTLWLAPSLLLGGIVVQPEALLLRRMEQGPLAFIRLVATILSSVLAISLALNGFGYWSLVAREVSRAGFYLIGTFWYVRWLPTLPIRFNGLSQHIRLGTNMSLAFIITAISGKIDSVLVGKFFGATDLGLFRQAQGLIVAPMEQFNAPIFNVAQPALSALQSQGPRYRRYYERMTGFIAMITMPLGVLVAVYAEEITLLLLGAKWADAAPFVRYFALAMALRPTLHSCTMVLVTLGRTTPLIWLELANNLLFVFFIVLGMSFGAVGAAFAFMAVTILFAPIRVHFSFKGTPVTAAAMFAASRVPICATAAMGIALLVASQITRAVQFRHGLAIGVLVAAFAYGAAWLLVPGGVSEFRRLVHDVGEAVRHRRSKASSS